MSERIRNEHTLFASEQPELCPNDRHQHWRVVECKDDRDTIECSRCGKQRNVACNFDEDMS